MVINNKIVKTAHINLSKPFYFLSEKYRNIRAEKESKIKERHSISLYQYL